MRAVLIAVFMGVAALSAPNAHAVWGWMRGAAIGDLNDADWEILKATTRNTLDNAPDGEQVNWRNEDTGNRGAMKVIMSFRHDGAACRRMAFLIVSTTTRGVANYNLCQQTDGTWNLVADSAVAEVRN